MASNTIVLKSCGGRHEEKVGNATIKPGYLLYLNSSDKVLPHNVAGGRWNRMVAKEDALQGKTTSNTYSDGDIVMIHQAIPGEMVQMRIPSGAATIAIGDRVMSNGDGTVIIYPSNGSKLYSNSAVSATLLNTGAGSDTPFSLSYTIPANFLKAGDIIKVRAIGTTPLTNGTDTFTFKIKVGSNVICATSAVDMANDDDFDMEAVMLVTAIGASGSYVAGGTGIAKGTALANGTAATGTTIDTTATQAITVTHNPSGASGNSAVLEILEITIDRQGQTLFDVALVTEAVSNTSSETLFSALVL